MTCKYQKDSLRYAMIFSFSKFKDCFFNEKTVLYKKLFKLLNKNKYVTDIFIESIYDYYICKGTKDEKEMKELITNRVNLIIDNYNEITIDYDDFKYFLRIEEIERFYRNKLPKKSYILDKKIKQVCIDEE